MKGGLCAVRWWLALRQKGARAGPSRGMKRARRLAVGRTKGAGKRGECDKKGNRVKKNR